MYSTKNIPWYFTGMTTMINLHIHNHNTMALKILWAIWDIVLIVGIVTGIIMTIKKKFGRASATESKVSAEIKHVWYLSITWIYYATLVQSSYKYYSRYLFNYSSSCIFYFFN